MTREQGWPTAPPVRKQSPAPWSPDRRPRSTQSWKHRASRQQASKRQPSKQISRANPVDNRKRTHDEPEWPDGVTEAARTGAAQASAADQITVSADSEPVPERPGQSEAVDTAEPVEEPPTGRRELTEGIQRNLKALGYEPGPIDGIYGPKTKRAIEAFERDMGNDPYRRCNDRNVAEPSASNQNLGTTKTQRRSGTIRISSGF